MDPHSIWVPFVAVGWAAVVPAIAMFALSRAGWARTAAAYPELGTPPKPVTHVGYGVFNGWCGYKGCLIIGTDAAGLHVRTWPFFLGWFHAPICVPWSEIRAVKPSRILWADYWDLELARVPQVRFSLRAGTFEPLRAAFEAAGVAVAPRP